LVRLVDDPDPIAVDGLRPVEEVRRGERNTHGSRLVPDITAQKGPFRARTATAGRIGCERRI
jgi:hypothetical protein